MQALGFCYFWAKPTCKASLKTYKNINTAEKSKSPSAAVDLYRFFIGSRGKPEPRVKPTIVILNAVKNLSVKDPSCLRMTENC
ncbi:hypothetical protein CA265_05075 [Sphingobacteriaceae bacterium GW460-11-11-14-LB5]|nr:hypothetical protein CA265_05075 [Sphingobacteriaceae bacterium GW460-11-11-14-LB5]